jgi:hypothetical protein
MIGDEGVIEMDKMVAEIEVFFAAELARHQPLVPQAMMHLISENRRYNGGK